MLDNLSRQDRELICRGQFNEVEGMALIVPITEGKAIVRYQFKYYELILKPKNFYAEGNTKTVIRDVGNAKNKDDSLF